MMSFSNAIRTLQGGETGIDNVVRWAYTHESYDVTQFLIGGEFLIIEEVGNIPTTRG